jgi:hypothetical protein
MRQRPPRVHLLIPHPSSPMRRSPIRSFGNIEFGGVVFDAKLLNMTGPLYIDMRSAPNMQNTMQQDNLTRSWNKNNA